MNPRRDVSPTPRYQNLFKVSSLLLVLTCHFHGSLADFKVWRPEFEGPWCAQRPAGQDCCAGRQDVCSVPILGTRCYCDVFCNGTGFDCCPDYFPHCHGINIRSTTLPPPRPVEPCQAPDGREYPVGEGYKENCNTCTCEVNYLLSGQSEWRCTDDVCLIRPELIREINDGSYSWRASNYSSLWGLTLGEGIRYRLGTFPLSKAAQAMYPIPVPAVDNLPESYDPREIWKGKLHPIQDQGNCASSWAHSSAAVVTDRLAHMSFGYITTHMSAQHLLSCNTNRQRGCQGGHVDTAWRYIWHKGIVTEDCYPYTSGTTNETGACLLSDDQDGGFCPSGIRFDKNKRYHVTPPYRVAGEQDIMREIYRKGSAQAIMQVREDFYMYRSGVYRHAGLSRGRGESGKFRQTGFHSVRIMGWGAENVSTGETDKYWICANSWGTEWGENGYFRIARGVMESQIEKTVIGTMLGDIRDDEQQEQLARGISERYKALKESRSRLGRHRRRRHHRARREANLLLR